MHRHGKAELGPLAVQHKAILWVERHRGLRQLQLGCVRVFQTALGYVSTVYVGIVRLPVQLHYARCSCGTALVCGGVFA